MKKKAMPTHSAMRGAAAFLLALLHGLAAAAGIDTPAEPASRVLIRIAMVERVPKLLPPVRDLAREYLAQAVDPDPQPRRVGSMQADVEGAIAVVYPDIGEPYRSVFTKIIEGIEQTTRAKVQPYAVGSNLDPVGLAAQLKASGVKVAIALGRQGLKAVSALDRDIPVVVGGVLLLPDAEHRALSGISLTPDPALLFARLKSLQPTVRRVLVVYDPQHNEWLIRLAREAARAQGLELVAHEARDLAGAIRLYEAMFASVDARRDALWLPQDPTTVDEAAVLPLVLRESWNRNVPVFSSSYLHVKKGALFVLYPNNVELGRTLAMSALRILSGDARKGMVPLREVYTAVNLRTASHIGLNISHQLQRSFDSVFPER